MGARRGRGLMGVTELKDNAHSCETTDNYSNESPLRRARWRRVF